MKQLVPCRRTTLQKSIASALYAGILATAIGLSLPAAAWAQSGGVTQFDIPAQPLPAALKTFAEQSGMQLLYRADAVSNRSARPVQGTLDKQQALQRLLEGTGLEAVYSSDNAVTIRPRSPASPKEGGGQAQSVPTDEPLGGPGGQIERVVADLDTVTVTGTRIRGGVTPSPVISIDAAQIQQEGFTDLGQAVRSISQNFRGGQNPGVTVGATLGAGGLANQNVTGGSSLNLRGLGPDASLTLLNGRRLAYGGFSQAVDISVIPVETVERMEIVADGASAIYGSDAVGGVGNVILKRDYEGTTVGMRYGTATEGGLTTREYSVTTGAVWDGGGVIAAYKDVSTDPIYARQRDYAENMFDPTSLYPGSDVGSGLVSLHQSLSDAVELRLDALRTGRDQILYPWNTGLTSYYNRLASETTTTLVSPSVEVLLPRDWRLSLGAGWGKDRHVSRQTDVDIATGSWTPYIDECYCNDVRSYEAGAEGPLFSLPGGDARIALGLGYRNNEFSQRSYITDTVTTQGSESSRFGYAEFNLPFVGPDNGVAGVHRLVLTAAVRGEDYQTFGGVTTPKVGLIYAPNADMTLKASWGKSFKAPTLLQRYWAKQAILNPATYFGGTGYASDATALAIAGGNPDLGPERARSWTASLAIHPEAMPELEAELTLFDIDYTDRVVQPVPVYEQALVNPAYAQFVNASPTALGQQEILSAADVFYNFSGAPYDPAKVVALLYMQYVNVARQRVRGGDLTGSYRFDLGAGRLTIRGSVSAMDSSQQSTPTDRTYDLAGTLFNPAKVNGRLGGVWVRGGFTGSIFANYTSGVTSTLIAGATEKTGSFTTYDANIRYDTGDRGDAWSGIEIAASAQNVLNRSPPLYTPTQPQNPPYDSTNYSAIGRFLSVSISKRF